MSPLKYMNSHLGIPTLPASEIPHRKHIQRAVLISLCSLLGAMPAWSAEETSASQTTESSSTQISTTESSEPSAAIPSRTEAEIAAAKLALEKQRADYKSARIALRRGQLTTYREYRDRLNTYPLVVYLDYYELQRNLERRPSEEVKHFLDSNQNSYLSDRLRTNWLEVLAKQSRWTEFQEFYDPRIATTELQCQALQSRLTKGDDSALQEVEPLWNVAESQPKECDHLFDLWMQAGGLTQEIAWSRFQKALDAGKTSLAQYISRKFTPPYNSAAALAIELRHAPHIIRHHRRFQVKNPAMRDVIVYGLSRYARQNPVRAVKEWQHYDRRQDFTSEQRLKVQEKLAIELVRDDQHEAADKLMANVPQITDTYVAERLIRESLKRMDWAQVYRYLDQLPVEEQKTERWQYWRARALEHMDIKAEGNNDPQQIYSQLANERSFYGFLAADQLERPYKLSDIPVSPSPTVIAAVANNPSLVRAKELYEIKDFLNSNREWYYMGQNFSTKEEHLAAAKLTDSWGWHQKTIISLATVKAWDDLKLRFPLAYNKQYFTAAKKNQVSPLLLFAISRQESAFYARARSPAGAMGLMQLMPATAKQTARKAGVRYHKNDLYQPDTNILLGSAYITELLDRFNDNRILATAAYNAGPHRVNQWLKRSDGQLPYDVWIEVIPFKETRKYVQNVLAYSVIYGYRTGTVPPMLSAKENQKML
ncbi:transglycosylase SLT domain-containing protein [Aestuariicella sp. G3-2]|uniref:transglycosylase SLT domain-containing protein n=1 Tax=Pseudomaricurvus albidus TaxID=2842452 RepID=UPI001C0BFBAD|nr:transglycosylase SLT domain-containing protein [Aestuariicella albida]MBU3071236.1 transglycosylase SLT domain-containing protein [Aestuariicella albida]